jgi:hypothetical protein
MALCADLICDAEAMAPAALFTLADDEERTSSRLHATYATKLALECHSISKKFPMAGSGGPPGPE